MLCTEELPLTKNVVDVIDEWYINSCYLSFDDFNNENVHGVGVNQRDLLADKFCDESGEKFISEIL